jgi:hypothetical protein
VEESKPLASTHRSRLQAWRETSDSVTPDLIVTFVVILLVLVGAGVLHAFALFGMGGLLSLAGYLYSRRRIR